MADGYFCIERGERGGEGRARVAVYEDKIGAKLRKAALKPLERLDGNIGKRLVLPMMLRSASAFRPKQCITESSISRCCAVTQMRLSMLSRR